MLSTVLSCHIGHGMTRTNQKCNSHLQSMSHATWMNLNAFIFEALRIKTECLAVQFHVQLLQNRISTRRMEFHEDPESKGWVIATAMPDPVFLEHPLSSWKLALAVALSGDNDLSSWI